MTNARHSLAAASAAAVLLAGASAAHGQTYEGPATVRPHAPSQAFELSLGAGWQQGFGALHGGSGGDFVSLAGPGAGIELGLAYRLSPRLSFGVRGDLAQLNQAGETPSSTTLRSSAVGVDATFHVAPFSDLDPWISAGAGYRFFWISPAGDNPTVMSHGFQVARLAVGLDYPVSADASLGPFVCADLDLFAKQTSNGQTSDITNRTLTTFLSAGIQGRFDVGGSRETARGVEIARVE